VARTARTDRSSVADAPLTVRFTRGERTALNKAVKIREKELGVGATVTQATLIRGLVRRYCEEHGIAIEEEDATPSEAAASAARPAGKRKGAGGVAEAVKGTKARGKRA
jgi:hypothetical protein